MNKFVKIVIYVPVESAGKIREALNESGAGKVGNYDYCSFTSRGFGRFRPLKGANPSIGEIGEIEEVEEARVETICAVEKLDAVLEAVKAVHPYEEPVIDVYPLLG